MLVHLSKWGNSLGIRIPQALVQQIGLIEGEDVELILEDRHILIKKVHRLDALLSKVTPENLHSEISTGSAIGKEEIEW